MSNQCSSNDSLIAPCGMNCGICSGYLARYYDVKNKGVKMPYCTGCRPRDKQCAFLKKRCDQLLNKKITYCYECITFPCKPLQHIDNRYRTFFRMSMIENLQFIKKNGATVFLKKEEDKWRCPTCGGRISCHNGICYHCGLEKLKKKKKPFRWEDD
ncbi:MAG: DUF3795 domain-containing protein [Methanobacteriota archaeon]